MNNKEKYILLFDGYCNLCNGAVQFIIKNDAERKFKFASLQSETGQTLLKRFNLPTIDLNSFVLIKEKKYFLKSSAALTVLIELNGGAWKLLYIFIIIPKPIRDFIYNKISKNRYKIFGKTNTCITSTPEINQRFL